MPRTRAGFPDDVPPRSRTMFFDKSVVLRVDGVRVAASGPAALYSAADAGTPGPERPARAGSRHRRRPALRKRASHDTAGRFFNPQRPSCRFPSHASSLLA